MRLVIRVTLLLFVTVLSIGSKAAFISNDTKSRKHEEEVSRTCDFYNGNWVADNTKPLYDFTCPFIDEGFNCLRSGRLDKSYLSYSWSPLNCSIPRFDGLKLLRKWKGKKIMFVGDSLSSNQFESLLCMIRSSVGAVADKSVTKEEYLTKVIFKGYEVTIMFDRTPYLVDLVRDDRLGIVLKLDSIEGGKLWMGIDVLIFNTWHWWTHVGKGQPWKYIEFQRKVYTDMDRRIAYYDGLTTWARWINIHVDPSRTQVFFQGVSPTHYLGQNWERPSETCNGQTTPYFGSRYRTDTTSATSVVSRVFSRLKKPVVLLDVTRLSEYRKDAHPSHYGGGENRPADCSHWCLPGLPDTWNRLLFAEIFT